MKQRMFEYSIRIALAATCFGALVNSATAGSFTRGCAARDLQILMLIEEHEGTRTISAEKLSDAMLTMLSARMVCYEGHVVDALAMYDGVARSLTLDLTGTLPSGLVMGPRR
jgi:hypothetical protein